MKNVNSQDKNGAAMRSGIFIPLALMIASLVSGCLSYSRAKQEIAKDLNEAIFALANENSELWTRSDTIAALRQLHETTRQPLIYQASDINFRHPALKDNAYYVLTLVDDLNPAAKIRGNKIASDSVLLVAERTKEGMAIQVQGFVDYSVASVFAASDQTLPCVLFALSLLSMASMLLRQRRASGCPAPAEVDPLKAVKLTPMQLRLTRMLLEAPDNRVDKSTLCSTLWGNKSNAEESLYTLVRRTKTALAQANIEIICNRGDSYEIRVNG